MNLEPRKTDPSLFDSFFAVFILMGGVTNAMAETGGHGVDSKNPDKGSRLELRIEKGNLRQAESKLQEERRRAAVANMLDARDAGKRNRLTPDERRDLRRQINQAGQDIYTNSPKPSDE